MKKTIHLLTVFLVVLLTFVGSAEEKKSSVAELLLNKVNELRTKHGRKAVTLDPNLTKAAQAHTDEMISLDYFSHVSPNGANTGPSERADKAGYKWFNIYENIYRSPLSEPEAYLEEAMVYWVDSAIHLDNMIAEKADDIGVGVGQNKKGETLITLMLGRD